MKFRTLFLLAVAQALVAMPLMAQPDAAGSRQCSLATLNGSYGFFGEAPASIYGTPLAVSGIIRFDGHGNLTGDSVDNVGGSGGSPVSGFSGTYTVSPDCTYSGAHTGEGGDTLHFVGKIAGEGMSQEMRFVVTDPGWVALGTVKKIPPGGCSLASLQGSYALFGQGLITAYDPAAPFAHVGTVTFDGAGNFVGSDTIMLNGTEVPDTFTGTYTVTQECQSSAEINSTAVGVIHELGWIVGTGESQEVRRIETDPLGFVFYDALRKQ